MGRIIFGTDSLIKYINQYAELFSPNQLSHIQQYLSGLICYVGRKTIVQLSYSIMMTTRDEGTLRKFLTRSSWNEKALHISRIIKMNDEVEDLIMDTEENDEPGFFILDDTVCPKRGKKMIGLGCSHCTIQERRVWSHCLVTSHFLYGEFDYPLLFDVYRHKEECRKDEFKTKIDLAESQIMSAPIPQGVNVYGLVDSSYMCQRLVNAFRDRGLEVIGRVKSSRLVSQDGRFDWQLIEYARFYAGKKRHDFLRMNISAASSSKKEIVWVREDIVTMPKFGKVKLLAITHK